MKEDTLTRGGLISDQAVTTNREKSAEVIVAKSRREGLNDAGVKSWESLVPT